MIKHMLIILALILPGFSCSDSGDQDLIFDKVTGEPGRDEKEYHKMVLGKLSKEPRGYVMIMAHRGDWKNAPENSLAAIENCIKMGLDIVEVDVQKTRDGKLILMHDKTLERTTNGSGRVSDLTWAEVRTLKLRNVDGSVSAHSIPTLEQAMLVAKDKIFVFIDKGYTHLKEVHAVLRQTATLQQAAVEGVATLSAYRTDYHDIWKDLNFVPRIGAAQSSPYINSHLAYAAGRFLFPSCNLVLSADERVQSIVDSGKWLMFSTLSNTNCSEDFENTWAWAIEVGMDIIITDRPRELLVFLQKEGRHL